jgi:uncharacterized protein (DUF2225 family)
MYIVIEKRKKVRTKSALSCVEINNMYCHQHIRDKEQHYSTHSEKIAHALTTTMMKDDRRDDPRTVAVQKNSGTSHDHMVVDVPEWNDDNDDHDDHDDDDDDPMEPP